MDERMRFVIRLQDGESMAALCREFGISRKTALARIPGRQAGESKRNTRVPLRN